MNIPYEGVGVGDPPMIEVVNRKTHRPTERDVYIGRGSPLGNPYKITKTVPREKCIELYKNDIEYLIYLGMDMGALEFYAVCYEINKISKMAQTGKVYLVCFCKPLLCHGDIIRGLFNNDGTFGG